jgi:hypothetical protein
VLSPSCTLPTTPLRGQLENIVAPAESIVAPFSVELAQALLRVPPAFTPA